MQCPLHVWITTQKQSIMLRRTQNLFNYIHYLQIHTSSDSLYPKIVTGSPDPGSLLFL